MISFAWLPLAAPAPLLGGPRLRPSLGRAYSCDVAGDGACRSRCTRRTPLR